MILEVIRKEFTDESTIGEMKVDGKFICYTLEDKVRSEKINGKTAIPAGKYEIVVDKSFRFKRDMPHILNVPNFAGVRIHSGNTDEDTEGCILVGLEKKKDFIGKSRLAFNSLFKLLSEKLKTEKVYIEIKEERC